MSNCSILTPEGAALLQSSLDDAILSAESEKDFKLKVKKLYQDNIKDTQDNIEDINGVFLNTLNDSISQFVDVTTWAQDYADNFELLESIYLLHQTESNKDLEGDKTEINKEDNKDGSFLYRVYGTSSSQARTDLEQRFASLLGQSVFFDPETLSEIRTQEDFNQAIIYKLNEVYQKFLENYDGQFKSEFPKGNLFDNIHDIEFKLSKIEEFKNVNQFTLDRWFSGKTNQDKARREAFQNYFILRNFDKLLQLNYSDVISINSSFKIGKLDFLPTDGKYSVIIGNKHLSQGWQSDEDLSDVIKESSGLIRLLFNSMEKRGFDGKVLGNLSFNEVTAFWTRLRSKQYHKNANVQVYNEASYLSPELKNYLTKTIDVGGGIIQNVPKFTLAELIREVPNSSLAIEALFTIMYNESNSQRYNVGMYHSDKVILKSLYEQIFSKSSVIYKTYHKPFPTDVVKFNEQPKNYLNFIEQFFTSTTHIPMTQLQVTETGAYQLNPISAANQRNQVARLRGNFNISFSASLDAINGKKKEFNTFVIDDSSFKRANEKDSELVIKIKGTDEKLTITPDLKVKYSGNEIDLELNKSLSNFIQEVLNINNDNFSEIILTQFRSLGINDEDLINLAGEILYNRTVSSKILKSDNMSKAKKLAKTYYADTLGEVLSMQRNKLEVNSFFSSANYNTAILLTQALDLLNGINRDTIGKGADGNLVNSRTTQQLAASASEQIQRSLNNPNSAVHELKSLKAYRGVEYARDLSGRGFNKKITEFSPAEHMAFDFIYDFATKYINADPKSKDKLVRILPLVISDKTRILKALIDLDEICPLYNKPYRELSSNQLYEVAKEEFGNFYQHVYNQIENDWTILGTYASSITTLNNYGSDEANNDVQFFIQAAKDLGNIFNIKQGFSNINAAIKEFKNRTSNEIRLNVNNYVDDNFSTVPKNENAIKTFNEFIEEWAKNHDCTFETAENTIKNAINLAKTGNADENQVTLSLEWEQFISSKVNDRAKAAVNNFLNALQIEQQKSGNPQIEIIENSYYVKDKLEFRPNVALLEELYRWSKITEDDLKRFGLTDSQIASSRGTYKEFFRQKNLQCLSDTLQDGTTITLAGQYGTEIKDKNILKLKEYLNEEGQRDGSGNWVTNGHSIILGKIKYQDYDEDGNLVDKFLRIKNAQSLTSINILDFAIMHYNKVDSSFNFDSIADYLDHPSFSFQTLEKIINTYFKHLDKALFNQREADLQKTEVINKLNERLNQRIENYQQKINEAKEEGNIDRAKKYEGYILEARNRFQEKLGNINQHYEELSERRKSFKEKGIKSSKSGRKVTILVNPLLEKFNTFSYIFGQQFTNATVGSYINHPGKKLANLKEFCSKATSQQVKRNVSESAAKHAFRLNLFDGLSNSVRSAIITNTQDLVSTISGEIADVFDYDGALFTNGATNYYENNSLKGDSVGVDKKLFIHDYTDKTGTGKIIKCAGFAATNYRIRNSFLWRDLNYKSLVGDESVLAPIIVNGGIDISRAFTGAKMEYGSIIYKKVCPIRGEFGVQDYLPIYDIQNNEINNIGHIIEVASIDGFDTEHGMVIFTINDHTANQVQQVKAQIKNAYDLWLFFGGAYSMDKVTSTEYNENSFKQVAFAGNWLGTNINGKPIQYLKESMIHYMPSVECTKQGASNINDITLFKHKENKLSTFMLNLYDAGVQLNAEHESDDSVLSMMTQVVNALGARGYTAEEAREVYAALNRLTRMMLSHYLDSLEETYTDLVKSRQKLETFISDILWKVLKAQSKNVNSDNLADCLLQQATELIREKGKVDFQTIKEIIPIDDPMFLRSLTSKISSILVSTSIKMKFPGTMDVLVPSNGFFTLYGNKMLGQYEEGIDNLPEETLNDVSEVKIGRTYHLVITKFDGTTIDKTIKVSTPKEYYYIKRYIKENTIDGLLNPSVQLFEVVNAGRELAGYNLMFRTADGRSFNMWDLDSVKTAFISGDQQQVTQTLQDALNALNPNNSNNITVQIDGQDLQVDKESIKIEPYEIIMSMLYKSQFGLRNGDDVQTIVDDRKFFLRRILEQRGSKLANEQFDIEIKTIDGNHKYLICDNNIPNGFTELDNIQEDEQGKRWYCDSKGRPVFQINYERDEEGNLTYSDVIYSNGSTLLIKTNDPSFYIDSSTVGLNISSRISEKSDAEVDNILTNLRTSESDFVKDFLEQYDNFVSDTESIADKLNNFIKSNEQGWEEVSKQLEEALNNNDEAKLTEILTIKEANSIYKRALQIHTSFIKSLDILAARIPAQCMQSFMAMKVVGFDESGLNSAYVSNHQIYLQGSDFKL